MLQRQKTKCILWRQGGGSRQMGREMQEAGTHRAPYDLDCNPARGSTTQPAGPCLQTIALTGLHLPQFW